MWLKKGSAEGEVRTTSYSAGEVDLVEVVFDL